MWFHSTLAIANVICSFGEHIKKFALSFELDEQKLAAPPIKDDQEAVTTFWGVYPWPHTKYNRFAHLEGLEQTADETKTMAQALTFIKSAHELGLSIDGCLGYLNGFDVNSGYRARTAKAHVFGKAKYVEESEDLIAGNSDNNPLSFVGLSAAERRQQELERMCVTAGWSGRQLSLAVESIRKNDHVVPEADVASLKLLPSDVNRIREEATDNVTVTQAPLMFDPNDHLETLAQLIERRNLARQKRLLDLVGLNPKDLSLSQREMLLEIEWAQRAFMQSYTIAIIDNNNIFENVGTFTIARLPSRHLHIIRRDDFWDALPNLKRVSLAIIPDWRDIIKEASGIVEDISLTPSMAVVGTYQLLLEQISTRKNIEHLHLEWVCGGEYAQGMFSRNQDILPAPIVAKASHMIDRSDPQSVSVLRFPYLKTFSLKNCWSSPHIMHRFLIGLEHDKVDTVIFDSVSLTAEIPRGQNPQALTTQQVAQQGAAQAPPLIAQAIQAAQAANNGLAVNIPGATAQNPIIINANANGAQAAIGLSPLAAPFVPGQQAAIANNPPGQLVAPPAAANVPLAPGETPLWLRTPREGSWTTILNSITPGQTTEDYCFEHSYSDEPCPRQKQPTTQFEFTSCGYVNIHADFDQAVIIDNRPLWPSAAIRKRRDDIESAIMKTDDFLLGKIINWIESNELVRLQNVFGMTVGWMARDQKRADLLADCHMDGVLKAGLGRFDGVLRRP